MLTQLNLKHRFRFILTADDIQRGKPDPEVYLLAAERLGIAPSQMMVLEDSANGCRAAVAAGAFTVAVPNRHTRDHIFAGARSSPTRSPTRGFGKCSHCRAAAGNACFAPRRIDRHDRLNFTNCPAIVSADGVVRHAASRAAAIAMGIAAGRPPPRMKGCLRCCDRYGSGRALLPTTFSAGGCRSCSNCHDYDPPVAACDCHACGTQRAARAAAVAASHGLWQMGPLRCITAMQAEQRTSGLSPIRAEECRTLTSERLFDAFGRGAVAVARSRPRWRLKISGSNGSRGRHRLSCAP